MAALLRVLQIVQTEAENLAGPRHRQAEAKTCQRPARRSGRPPGQILQRRKLAVVRPQPLAEIGGDARVDRLQVDDRIRIENAKSRSAVRLKTDDAHAHALRSPRSRLPVLG